jgi:hypothetical protein
MSLRRGPTEYQIHRAFTVWLRRWLGKKVVWWHTPNETNRNPAEAHVQHLLGLRPGVADFVLVGPGGVAHFLELKAKDGQLSHAQRDFLNACHFQGARVGVAYSIEQAALCVLNWGLIPAATQAEAGASVPDPNEVIYKKRAKSTLKHRRSFAQPYD